MGHGSGTHDGYLPYLPTYLPTYLPSSDGEVDSGQNVTSADLKLPLLTNSIHTILPTLPY